MKLFRKKIKALWKCLNISSPPELFGLFQAIRIKTNKKCITTNNQQYHQFLSERLKQDHKTFWSFHAVKSKTRRPKHQLPIKIEQLQINLIIRLPSSKNFFARCTCQITLLLRILLMIWCTQIRSHFENIYHSLSSRRHFVQFNVNKATGVDDIPLRIFGICAKELFNLSFSMGEVPLCQTSVFKANAIENVEIDLFPCYKILGKRQERIVHRAISHMYHLFSLISSMAS